MLLLCVMPNNIEYSPFHPHISVVVHAGSSSSFSELALPKRALLAWPGRVAVSTFASSLYVFPDDDANAAATSVAEVVGAASDSHGDAADTIRFLESDGLAAKVRGTSCCRETDKSCGSNDSSNTTRRAVSNASSSATITAPLDPACTSSNQRSSSNALFFLAALALVLLALVVQQTMPK